MTRTGPGMPCFGGDLTRIDGYALAGAEHLARILVPLERPNGSLVSWRRAAPIGARISGNTRWSEYANEEGNWPIGSSPGQDQPPPYGVVDLTTVQAITTVLCSERSRATGFVLALSAVYADSYQHLRQFGRPLVAPRGAPPLIDQHHARLLVVDDLDALELAGAGAASRFPIAIWPLGLEWALAAPPYFDSLILSSSRDVFARFERGSLEAFTVTAQQPNPIEGD